TVITFAILYMCFITDSYIVFVCYFFFQAEDGIRDSSVTGVQTCALPIFVVVTADVYARHVHLRSRPRRAAPGAPGVSDQPASGRSEERRVGKECSCGRARDECSKKGR